MRKTYQYKLRLTSQQRQEIERWLNMLRYQYNYLLAERFHWWQYNRCDVVLPQGEGLEKLYVDSNGNQALPEKHFRKSEEQLGKLQQKLADKSRSLKVKRLIRDAIARLHQKVARQRQDWHYKQAHKLLRGCNVLVIEDLNIRNLKRKNKPKKEDGVFLPNGQAASSGLNKSWSDNAIGQFVEILHQVAQKYGVRIIKINPKGTSQHCSQCLNRVSKSLSDRWHSCPQCSLSIDRDENSAILIKRIAIESVAVGSRNSKTLPSLKLILG